jgi:hypothetical protein
MNTLVKIVKGVVVVGVAGFLVLWLLAMLALAWLDGIQIG